MPPAHTLGEFGDQAFAALVRELWADGRWRACPADCRVANEDWGDDAMTYVLYLRWRTHPEPALRAMAAKLITTATRYGSCEGWLCFELSDKPAWDAIALVRDYDVTANRRALDLAARA